MLLFVEDWLQSHQPQWDAAQVVHRAGRTPSDAVASISVQFVCAKAEAQLFAWEDGRMDATVAQDSGEIVFSAHAAFGADYQSCAAHFLAIVLEQITRN